MPGRGIGLQGTLVIVALAIVSLFLYMAIRYVSLDILFLDKDPHLECRESSTGHPFSTWPQSTTCSWAHTSPPDLQCRCSFLSVQHGRVMLAIKDYPLSLYGGALVDSRGLCALSLENMGFLSDSHACA